MLMLKIIMKEVKALIPSHYTEEEKEKIIILLTNLAYIYLELEKEK